MEPISNVLFGLYRGTPQHEDWVIACLEGAWPAILGARLAAVCRPSGLKGSQLTIQVTDSSWVAALEGERQGIAAKLGSATAGVVSEIRIEKASASE